MLWKHKPRVFYHSNFFKLQIWHFYITIIFQEYHYFLMYLIYLFLLLHLFKQHKKINIRKSIFTSNHIFYYPLLFIFTYLILTLIFYPLKKLWPSRGHDFYEPSFDPFFLITSKSFRNTMNIQTSSLFWFTFF